MRNGEVLSPAEDLAREKTWREWESTVQSGVVRRNSSAVSGCKGGVKALVARRESISLLPGGSPVFCCQDGVQFLVAGRKYNYTFPRESHFFF